MVPLLPKLRGYFAEFLNHSSPDRLGILYLTTCVGLGYGPLRSSLEAFLDSIGSPASPLRARHHISGSPSRVGTRICLCAALPAYPGTTTARVRLPSCVTPSLAYYPLRSPAAPTHDPKVTSGFDGLSVMRFSMGGPPRVREYQPVVHRLRLSASP